MEHSVAIRNLNPKANWSIATAEVDEITKHFLVEQFKDKHQIGKQDTKVNGHSLCQKQKRTSPKQFRILNSWKSNRWLF